MKIFNIIVSFLLLSFSKCAPNLVENSILQTSLKSELNDKPNGVIATRTAQQQNTRREMLNENKKKRCELCRESKRCKVQGKCELCNVVCKENFVFQTSGNPSVGDILNNIQDATESISKPIQSTINSERFYTVGNVGPGPKQNVLARLLDIPKKNNLGNLVVLENPNDNEEAGNSKQPVIIDTANVFKTNQEDAEIFSVDNKTNHVEQELMAKIEKELDMATEEKKRLFNESQLTKDEINKIISHAKSLHQQRKGIKPEIHLRSRSIADTNTPVEETEEVNLSTKNYENETKRPKLFSNMKLLKLIDINRPAAEVQQAPNATNENNEKEWEGNKLFGNRAFLKPRFSSLGLRRKLEEDNAEETIKELPNGKVVKSKVANIPNILENDNVQKLSIDSTTEGVLQFKHKVGNKDTLEEDSEMLKSTQRKPEEKEHSITSDQFTWILKNLEKKVENIADLVRKTCGQPSFANTENMVNPPESDVFPLRKNVVTESPIVGVEKSDGEIQRGMQQNVLSPIDDETDFTESDQNKGNELLQLVTDPSVGCSNEESEETLGNAKAESSDTPRKLAEEGNSDGSMELKSRNGETAPPANQISAEFIGEETPSENMSEHMIKNHLKEKPSIENSNDPLKGINGNKFLKPLTNSRPSSEFVDAAPSGQLIKPIIQNTEEILNKLTDNISPVQNGNPKLQSTNAIEATGDQTSYDPIHVDNMSPPLEQRFGGEAESIEGETNSPINTQFKTPIPYSMFGRIIPQENRPGDEVIFVSSGMQLPFNMKKHPDGSYQLSMDVKKLCNSCNDGNCQRELENNENHMVHSSASIENENQPSNLQLFEKDKHNYMHSNVQKIVSSKVTSHPSAVENDSTSHQLRKRDINNMYKKRKALPTKTKNFLKTHSGTNANFLEQNKLVLNSAGNLNFANEARNKNMNRKFGKRINNINNIESEGKGYTNKQ